MSFEERLRSAERTVTTEGVVERVAALHARRQRRRRQTLGVSAAATVAATVAAVALIGSQVKNDTVKVAVAPTTTSVVPEPVEEIVASETSWDGTKALVLESLTPPSGFSAVHAPIVGDDRGGIWVVGNRGPVNAKWEVDSIIHVDANRSVQEIVDFQGTVRSMTTVKGIVYAVVDEPHDGSIPALRFKRVVPGIDGAEATFKSVVIPSGSELAGEIVPQGGSIWIPVRTGVLRFDGYSGQLEGSAALPSTELRVLVPGPKGVWSSDGSDMALIGPNTLKIIQRAPVGGNVVSAGGIQGTVEGSAGTDLAIRNAAGRVSVVRWDPGFMDDGATVPAAPTNSDRLIGDDARISSDWLGIAIPCSRVQLEQKCAVDDPNYPVSGLQLSGLPETAHIVRFGSTAAYLGYNIVIASSNAVWFTNLHTLGVY